MYSFGVVALEIAKGRMAVEVLHVFGQREMRVVEQVWELNGVGWLLEAAGAGLCGDLNMKQIETLLLNRLWCVHPGQRQRPSMRQVIQALTSEGRILDIPKTMQVPFFVLPPLEILNSDLPLVTYASIINGR